MTVRRLHTITFLDSLGTGSYVAISVVYFVQVRGLSTGGVSLVLGLAAAGAALAGLPLGVVSDWLGARPVLVISHVAIGTLFAFLPQIRGPVGLGVVLVTIAVLQASIGPAKSTLLYSYSNPEQRTREQAIQRSIFNIGFAVGAAVSAVVTALAGDAGSVGLIYLNACSYLGCAVVAIALAPRTREPTATATATTDRGPLAVVRDRPFLLLTGLYGALALSECVIVVGVPMWVVTVGAPQYVIPFCLLLNTAAVIVLQTRFSRAADGTGRSRRFLTLGALAFAAGAASLAAVPPHDPSRAQLMILLATAAFTLCELLASAGAWALVLARVGARDQGAYFGTFGMSFSLQAVAGPLLFGWIVVPHGAIGWLVLGVAAVALLPAIGATVTRLGRARTRPQLA
ncbi:MFS transporter [Cryptosporangium sp. NPDC051539]|uniref:MFS transporter n=1 Tax=Cryptosporangium sp. NPDC051539 TaxID=3363962 RepID=UPI00378C9DF8